MRRCLAGQVRALVLHAPGDLRTAPSVRADHVFVKADCSNLASAIAWCKKHDEECRAIVARAREKATAYLSREGLLNYVELVLCEVAAR